MNSFSEFPKELMGPLSCIHCKERMRSLGEWPVQNQAGRVYKVEKFACKSGKHYVDVPLKDFTRSAA